MQHGGFRPDATSWIIYSAIKTCSICLLLRTGNMWLTEICETVSNTPSFASESVEFYLSGIHKGSNVTVDLWVSNIKLYFLKFSHCSSFLLLLFEGFLSLFQFSPVLSWFLPSPPERVALSCTMCRDRGVREEEKGKGSCSPQTQSKGWRSREDPWQVVRKDFWPWS